MIEVKKLERDQWKNYELKFSYDTDGYYSFKVYDWDFQLIFHPYETVINKTFTSHLFEEWWEAPMAFGAFDNNNLTGVVECFLESWSNRLRITNLLVFEDFRNQGIGKLLIDKALEMALNNNARMVALETQSCNRKAIDFYIRMGFLPIGFDLYCYTNHDPDKTEVRLEMARRLVP